MHDERSRIATCGQRLLWALVLCLAAANAFGQTDDFSTEIAVANRSTDEREDAYSRGLRQVLLANSGDKTLINRDDVRAALAEAESYVETFRYRVPEAGTLIPVDTPVTARVRDTGEATALLFVRFDRNRVVALIRGDLPAGNTADSSETDASARVSDALLWLLLDDGGRSIRGADAAATTLRARLRELAGGAGVSLIFPVDDTATGPLTNAAMRSLDIDAARRASERSAAAVVVLAHVSRDGVAAQEVLGAGAEAANTGSGSGWVAEWVRFSGGAASTRQTRGNTIDEAVKAGIAWLVSDPRLGQPVAYEFGGTGSSAEALVRFVGVDTVRDYTDLTALLNEVPGLSASSVREISADEMVFSLRPRRLLSAVATALDSAGWLRRSGAVADTDADATRRSDLVYNVLR